MYSKMHKFLGIFALIGIGIIETNAIALNSHPAKITKVEVVNGTSNNSIPISPQPASPELSKPKAPQCYSYIPGTPGWNECFRRFYQQMDTYQYRMQEFVKEQSDKIDAGLRGDTANNGSAPRPFYSAGSSFYNSNGESTSNSYTGGYSIHAVNMQMSTNLQNNSLEVRLHTGPTDKLDVRTKDNELTLFVASRGQRKWATITVPQGINVKSVKIERTPDSIYVIGPTVVYVSGNSTQHSESSNTGFSGMFNENFEQMETGS